MLVLLLGWLFYTSQWTFFFLIRSLKITYWKIINNYNLFQWWPRSCPACVDQKCCCVSEHRCPGPGRRRPTAWLDWESRDHLRNPPRHHTVCETHLHHHAGGLWACTRKCIHLLIENLCYYARFALCLNVISEVGGSSPGLFHLHTSFAFALSACTSLHVKCPCLLH